MFNWLPGRRITAEGHSRGNLLTPDTWGGEQERSQKERSQGPDMIPLSHSTTHLLQPSPASSWLILL